MEKKRKKKIEKKTDADLLEKEQNRQLMVFFAITLLCLGGLIAGYLYVQQRNNFSFGGIDFQRGREGEIIFFHSRFPINYRGQLTTMFNLYLRVDPRKNKIPINANFSLSPEIIMTFEPGLEKCEEAIVGHSTLAQFVSVFPWVKNVSGAVSNKSYAKQNELLFADCSSATTNRTIIFARVSEKESIEQEGKNCYILNVKNCRYLEITERAIIGMIAQINEEKI